MIRASYSYSPSSLEAAGAVLNSVRLFSDLAGREVLSIILTVGGIISPYSDAGISRDIMDLNDERTRGKTDGT
jgi:hypothetical protein